MEKHGKLHNKTVLLVDDEQGFLEALEDALVYEGCNVLKATTAEDALRIIRSNVIDLATIDIMLPQGSTLESQVDSHISGIFLCKTLRQTHPRLPIFCISVINDSATIKEISQLGIQFLRKGEIPLRAVLARIISRITGLAYVSKGN